MRHLWGLALAVVLLAAPAQAQSSGSFWVLREPDQAVQYDAPGSAARRAVQVPRRLLEHPEFLTVNAKGQMLFVPPRGAEWGSGEMASAGGRVWLWDGSQAREWPLGDRPAGGITITLDWFLSAGGDALFVLETRVEKVVDPSGLDLSVRTTARVRRTDLTRGSAVTIASLPSSGQCMCATGVCSETCPEWSLWAPGGVVGDAFLVTLVTPGQIGSTWHESLLYRRTGQQWRATKLPQPLEQPFAASSTGDLVIAAVLDGGCCAWMNEGSDKLLLVHGGAVAVLYDEFTRYDNSNYDVSFYPSNARLAPGRFMVAYTLVSTAKPGDPIPLSSSGTERPDELARVRATIAELPSIEVVRLSAPPQRTAVIPHAALVGWLNDREILTVRDGSLTVYDLQTARWRDAAIRVRTAADVFLP